MIESLKLIKTEEKVNLVFAGKRSPYLQELIAQAEKNGSENQVYFPGHVDLEDLPGVYQGAKGLFYPSFREGFGIPMVEAMFSDLRVITTQGSVFREIAGEFGIFCDPDSSFDFSVAMREVWENQRLTEENEAKMHAHRAQFHPVEAARRMMGIYKDTLQPEA